MKLELVSEQKINDSEPSYYIYLDGKYVEGSFTRSLKEAQIYYEKVYNNPDIKFNSRKVLQTAEVNVSS